MCASNAIFHVFLVNIASSFILSRTEIPAFLNVVTLSRSFTSHTRSFGTNAKPERKQKIEKRDENKSINMRCVKNLQTGKI